MKVTLELLQSFRDYWGNTPCNEQLEKFKQFFPNGAKITKENLEKCQEWGLDVYHFVKYYASHSVKAEIVKYQKEFFSFSRDCGNHHFIGQYVKYNSDCKEILIITFSAMQFPRLGESVRWQPSEHHLDVFIEVLAMDSETHAAKDSIHSADGQHKWIEYRYVPGRLEIYEGIHTTSYEPHEIPSEMPSLEDIQAVRSLTDFSSLVSKLSALILKGKLNETM